MNIEQHDRLVEMLLENTTLGEPVLYPPVIQTRPEMIRIGQGSRIDSFCKLEGGEGLTIGRYVHVASYAHLNIGGGTLTIGDYCAVASGGRIVTGGNSAKGKSMSAVAPQELQQLYRSSVVLEPYSVVLTGATVLPGVTLHEGAVLAAGSLAHSDIPQWEIWSGSPAKYLKSRICV